MSSLPSVGRAPGTNSAVARSQDARASDSPILCVKNLTAGFLRQNRFLPALSDVSLAVSPGETLGLVGESGSGKSVLALSILRLLPAPGTIRGGQIFFKDADLLTFDERAMRQLRGAGIGLVFQEPATALNPVLPIGDQVAAGLVAHGVPAREAKARALVLLEAVRIPDPARRYGDYPHHLSGGLRQRVMIAAALACDPPLLIADEPTTALDATIQADILDLLAELRDRRRLALLLVTHDLGVVARLAARVAVIYAGRIVEEGPATAVLGAPVHPYTRALRAAMPTSPARPGQRLRAIEGSVPPLGAVPPGCAFEPRCADRVPACRVAVPLTRVVRPGHAAACVHVTGEPARG